MYASDRSAIGVGNYMHSETSDQGTPLYSETSDQGTPL